MDPNWWEPVIVIVLRGRARARPFKPLIRPRHHLIPKDPHTFHLDLDDITGLHGASGLRGACVDDVTRLERNVLADVADDGFDVEDQIAGALLLPNLAIQSSDDLQ